MKSIKNAGMNFFIFFIFLISVSMRYACAHYARASASVCKEILLNIFYSRFLLVLVNDLNEICADFGECHCRYTFDEHDHTSAALALNFYEMSLGTVKHSAMDTYFCAFFNVEFFGAQIGDVLERDIAFGIVSESGADIIVDCRATSLKEAAVSNSVVLAYDSSWATNAALLTISAVPLAKEGGEISSATEKTIFSAAADCTGNVPLPCPGRGWWRPFCRVYGADGESPILEYTSCDFKFRNGFILILQ
jgi:hypothetical protein